MSGLDQVGRSGSQGRAAGEGGAQEEASVLKLFLLGDKEGSELAGPQSWGAVAHGHVGLPRAWPPRSSRFTCIIPCSSFPAFRDGHLCLHRTKEGAGPQEGQAASRARAVPAPGLSCCRARGPITPLLPLSPRSPFSQVVKQDTAPHVLASSS